MKQIVIISGKGGTGKTILTASFAALSKNAVFADCDVDAADLHLLLNPNIRERHEFRSGKTARVDKELCQQCEECVRVCRFAAIDTNIIVDPISCEGCGVCSYICPVGAIKMEENIAGDLFISDTKYGPMVHAKLGIAEENSGKLVTLVRQKAKEMAERNNSSKIIIDGPPGIGCPVIASLTGADLAVIVTEPTLSGIHDMERIADVTKHFGIHAKVVVNKYDINLSNTQIIKRVCQGRDMEVIAQLPFSEDVSRSLVKKIPIVEYCNERISKDIIGLWKKI
ncbi:MAG: ATP-binding protein [Candidatus Omnitrophica bacterium]|nr:ATP-binding protein [Candidatus Omnitrophota bacterium]